MSKHNINNQNQLSGVVLSPTEVDLTYIETKYNA